MNIETLIPKTRAASRFRGEGLLRLPDEYEQFLERYPQTVLVSFGVTWTPQVKDIVQILQAAERLDKVGFILSLKENWESYKIAKQQDLKNVFLSTFVPQKELLNDERVFTFITHGGANSLIEAMYYGKTLIGLPLAVDQVGSCYRIELMGISVSLRQNPTVDKIIEAIEQMR